MLHLGPPSNSPISVTDPPVCLQGSSLNARHACLQAFQAMFHTTSARVS